MLNDARIAVVIPSYKVLKQLKKVVESVPDYVDFIVIVDDCCPQESYKSVEKDERIHFIHHESNQGVGGAVQSGYAKALELGADYVVKVDGDGQMDMSFMRALLDPLMRDEADYTKGNRFSDFSALKKMPKVRLFGNSVLSFLVKASSGYWNIMDPTNGFTAISKKAIEGLDSHLLSQRYFFESDMLIHLNIEGSVVKDIPIPAKYEGEHSSLSISRVLLEFPFKLFRGGIKRIFYRYFIYDFNMASIYILLGVPLSSFGFLYGGIVWYNSASTDIEATTGTVMLCVLPIILGVQFLLQAVSIDIDGIPKKVNSL